MCQGYTPRVLTKYSIFIRKNTTQAHQNEKICQQSTFLTFIIYGHTLSRFLSCFRSFSFDAFDHFSPFLVRGFLPLFGKTRNIIPPKQTPQAAFSPAHSQDFPSRKLFSLSLSLSFAERCLFLPFSFLAEDIYIYIFFFSRCLDLPERRRERVGKIIIGETIRFFRYSFRAFIFRETLQFEKPET